MLQIYWIFSHNICSLLVPKLRKLKKAQRVLWGQEWSNERDNISLYISYEHNLKKRFYNPLLIPLPKITQPSLSSLLLK